MKKIIPIVLILLILFINLYGFLKKDNIPNISYINLEDEDKAIVGDDFTNGNMENSAGASTFYIENIDLILDFLNIDMMLDYRDILTFYSINLPKIATDNVEEFYDINKEMLFDIYGICCLDEFNDLNKLLKEAKIDKNSNPAYVKINDIKLEGNLLRIDVTCYFDNKEVDLSHYLNYLYVNGEEKLFVYGLGVMD
ncbi:MAG: hypothetical protein M0Q88_02685 [Bacilli bacterium]|nr:hypothetical protein [Bacilli bacterium]